MAISWELSKQDIEVITNGEWLTDRIIGAAQSVLRKQFPYIRGMENTTLGQFSSSQFKRVSLHKSYTREDTTGFWFPTLDVFVPQRSNYKTAYLEGECWSMLRSKLHL